MHVAYAAHLLTGSNHASTARKASATLSLSLVHATAVNTVKHVQTSKLHSFSSTASLL